MISNPGSEQDERRLLASHKAAPRRRVRGKQAASSNVKKLPKSQAKAKPRKRLFAAQQVLTAVARSAMQAKMKLLCSNVLAASISLPDSMTCIDAVKHLCAAAELDDSEAVQWSVRDKLTDQDRKHQKMAASVSMRHERGNDIYLLFNGHKRQVCMVSTGTHGSQNVSQVIATLLVCYVCGFTSEELTKVKYFLQDLVADDTV